MVRVTVRVQQSGRQARRRLALQAPNMNARPQQHMHRDDGLRLTSRHEHLDVRRLPECAIGTKRYMERMRRNRSVLLEEAGQEVRRVTIHQEQMLLQYDSQFRLRFLRTQGEQRHVREVVQPKLDNDWQHRVRAMPRIVDEYHRELSR